MIDAIKTCPFCSSYPIVGITDWGVTLDCCAVHVVGLTLQDATSIWNTQASKVSSKEISQKESVNFILSDRKKELIHNIHKKFEQARKHTSIRKCPSCGSTNITHIHLSDWDGPEIQEHKGAAYWQCLEQKCKRKF